MAGTPIGAINSVRLVHRTGIGAWSPLFGRRPCARRAITRDRWDGLSWLALTVVLSRLRLCVRSNRIPVPLCIGHDLRIAALLMWADLAYPSAHLLLVSDRVPINPEDSCVGLDIEPPLPNGFHCAVSGRAAVESYPLDVVQDGHRRDAVRRTLAMDFHDSSSSTSALTLSCRLFY